MARLLPLLLLLALVVLVVVLRLRARPRSDRVYRPRARPFGRPARDGGNADWVVHADELADVRDAYSSARIDPSRPLRRCGGCQAWYDASSVAALERENAGRCALCGSTDLRDVHVV